MALWGKTDELASVPKWLETDANNTNASNDADNAVFVDVTEAGVASNRAKGLKTPGWNLYSNAGGRHRSEVLVAMKVSAADAGDIGVNGEIIAFTSALPAVTYVIRSLGDVVWETFDAGGDNSPYAVGDTFVMNSETAVGTGTVQAAGDDLVVADA